MKTNKSKCQHFVCHRLRWDITSPHAPASPLLLRQRSEFVTPSSLVKMDKILKDAAGAMGGGWCLTD